MKKAATICLALALAFTAKAQYTPATAPETVYSSLNPMRGIWNMGTDTRAEFDGPYGSTSVWFANFLNVTVTDHVYANGPLFCWHGSHTTTTFGSQYLPIDAYDPDVVLIENNTSIYALAVYYSAINGGYCMSWSRFVDTVSGSTTITYFEPLSAPMLIEPYLPAEDSLICINIDSDNDGNYAIAYQMNNKTYCKTGTLPPGTTPIPTTPGNTTVYGDHIQPDVTLQHSNVIPNMKVKIVGLSENRSVCKVAMRTFAGAAGPSVSSPVFPPYNLNNPRIASPLNNTERYAVTLMQHNPGSSTYHILFSSYTGITPTSTRVLNAGAAGFPPSIAGNVNQFPAITYVGDYISIGWHTSYLPGPPAPQSNTFVGLDLQDGSFMPTTPTKYQDICPSPNFNPLSAMALSGRYTIWGKSAAYERITATADPVAQLVWVARDMVTGLWRPSQPTQIAGLATSAGFSAAPNPASGILTVKVPRPDTKYSYAVLDMLGKKVLEGTISNGKEAIDVHQLAKGAYFIRIGHSGTGHTQSVKFVKH